MKEICFVHAANPCLDQTFPRLDMGTYGKRIQNLLVNAPMQAMEKLVDLCIAEKADFLILTGKLLVHSPADPQLRSFIANSFKRLSDKNIAVVLCSPVQDNLLFAEQEKDLPELHIFNSASIQAFPIQKEQKNIALIQGIGRPEHMPAAELLSLFKKDENLDCFQLAILPCMIAQDAQDSPEICQAADLAQTGFNAIIPSINQTRAILNTHPYIASPGPIIPHDSGSFGPHGCLLARCGYEDGWICNAEFRNLSPVIFEKIYINTEESDNAEQIKSALIANLKNLQASLGPSYSTIMANCKIFGITPLNALLHSQKFHNELKEIFSHFANGNPPVLLQRLAIDASDNQKQYERDDLVGEIFRLGNDLLADSKQAELFRATALAPLFAHPELANMLEAADPADLARLLLEATHLCQSVLEDN